MHGGIRRLFVLAMALALVASAMGRAAAGAVPQQPCHHHAHDASSHGHDHGEHAEHGLAHQHHDGASEKSPADKICNDCCGVCTLASAALPPRAPGETAFAATPIVYLINPETCRERPVVIDPGIPKATA